MGSILNESVMEENVELVQQVHALQQQVLQSPTFHVLFVLVCWISLKPRMLRFYIGLPNYEAFQALLACFESKVIELGCGSEGGQRIITMTWRQEEKANLASWKSWFGCYNALTFRVVATRHCRQIQCIYQHYVTNFHHLETLILLSSSRYHSLQSPELL